jgi:hypothetical protein
VGRWHAPVCVRLRAMAGRSRRACFARAVTRPQPNNRSPQHASPPPSQPSRVPQAYRIVHVPRLHTTPAPCGRERDARARTTQQKAAVRTRMHTVTDALPQAGVAPTGGCGAQSAVADRRLARKRQGTVTAGACDCLQGGRQAIGRQPREDWAAIGPHAFSTSSAVTCAPALGQPARRQLGPAAAGVAPTSRTRMSLMVCHDQ